MSDKIPSKEQALQFLKQSKCSGNVIRHCKAVTRLALEIAEACLERGYEVDLKLVEIGALLHDIGRSQTHSVHHAIEGVRIAESLGVPQPVVAIIKRHVGGGITQKEAKKLGWPKDVYVPQTLEEKIVSYADKRVEGLRRVSIRKTIDRFSQSLPPPCVERVQKLHDEMVGLIGDCECLP